MLKQQFRISSKSAIKRKLNRQKDHLVCILFFNTHYCDMKYKKQKKKNVK